MWDTSNAANLLARLFWRKDITPEGQRWIHRAWSHLYAEIVSQ